MPLEPTQILTSLILSTLACAYPLIMGANGGCGGAPPPPPPNELVSDYAYATGDSHSADVSESGQFVVFEIQACYGELPCSPGNVYLTDRINGWTTPVAHVEDGAMYSADHREGSVSSNGTRVAFTSVPIAGATPPALTTESQVYIVDVVEDPFGAYFTTTLVSAGPNNTNPWSPEHYGDGDSSEPDLSGNGRYLVFTSEAANLTDGDTNGTADIYRADLDAGTIAPISVAHDGGEADGASSQAVVSYDGRFVAFTSEATNLVPNDTNGLADVFLYDAATQTTTRISMKEDGSEADAPSQTPSISAHGRVVAFQTTSDLVSANAGSDGSRIIVYDHDSGALEQVSFSTVVTWVADYHVSGPSVSPSGNKIAFEHQCFDCSIDGPSVHVFDRAAQSLFQACSTGTGWAAMCTQPAATDAAVVLTVLGPHFLPGDAESSADIGFIHRGNWFTIWDL